MLTWVWYSILVTSAVILAIVLFQLRDARKKKVPFVLSTPLNRFLRLSFLFAIFALLISGGFFQDTRIFMSDTLSKIDSLEEQAGKAATRIAQYERALITHPGRLSSNEQRIKEARSDENEKHMQAQKSWEEIEKRFSQAESAQREASKQRFREKMAEAMPAAVTDHADVIAAYGAARGALEEEIRLRKNLLEQPDLEEKQKRLDKLSSLQETLETLSPPSLSSSLDKIIADVKQRHSEAEDRRLDELKAKEERERKKAGEAYRKAQETLRELLAKHDELEAEPGRTKQHISSLKEQRQRITNRLKILDEDLKPQMENTTQIFLLVLRALFLGGLGALATSLLSIQREGDIVGFMDSEQYFYIIIYDAIIGSIISLAGLTLAMFTNILTLLPLGRTSPDGTEDTTYWQVAFLCLVLGAFSRTAYYAVYRRIRRFTSDDEKNGAAK